MNITIYASHDSIWTILSAIGTILSAAAALFLAWWCNRNKRRRFVRLNKFNVYPRYEFINQERREYDFHLIFKIKNNCDLAKLSVKYIKFEPFNKRNYFFILYFDTEIDMMSILEVKTVFSPYYPRYKTFRNIPELFQDTKFSYEEFNPVCKIKILKTPYIEVNTNFGSFKSYPSKEFLKIWRKELKKDKLI